MKKDNRKNPLTERETITLTWVSRGKKNKAIAQIMYISDSTVKAHLGQSYKKLGVTNRTEAVLKAIELGIIPPPNSKQP